MRLLQKLSSTFLTFCWGPQGPYSHPQSEVEVSMSLCSTVGPSKPCSLKPPLMLLSATPGPATGSGWGSSGSSRDLYASARDLIVARFCTAVEIAEIRFTGEDRNERCEGASSATASARIQIIAATLTGLSFVTRH